jgi:Fur family transcriptional regulator, ferric uptake regulator
MVDALGVLQQVRDEAKRRGIRWTNQRQVIVETFLASHEHLTAESLHRLVRELDASVSAATVYRTVNLLVEIGVAHRRHFGGGSATFEPALNKAHHDHLVCLACGTISEFHHDAIERLQEDVAREQRFHLVSHRLELYGLCATCQAKGSTIPASAWAAHAERTSG